VKLFAFGSSLLSCYWNGAATYYRGIYRNLHALGHDITFAEPDIYDRQKKRDSDGFSYATSLVYRTPDDLPRMLARAAEADVVIKHSGVGADDEFLEREVLRLRGPRRAVAFWDVDGPATLARVEGDASDPFRTLIPEYDFIFTYGGGPPIVAHYTRLGAQNCYPIYNGLEPETHTPVPPDPKYKCDLVFVGNRMPDREKRVEQFFLRAAELAPDQQFLLGGEGWAGKAMPKNVRWIGHVPTAAHNAINCSARLVLNLNRDSMVQVGFSPPTRVFEAAGAGACMVTDSWEGIDAFFAPGEEILVAGTAEELVTHLRTIAPARALQIGAAMRARALREHTYASRARLAHDILMNARARAAA
jgi:spore maturation protein CgeB